MSNFHSFAPIVILLYPVYAPPTGCPPPKRMPILELYNLLSLMVMWLAPQQVIELNVQLTIVFPVTTCFAECNK